MVFIIRRKDQNDQNDLDNFLMSLSATGNRSDMIESELLPFHIFLLTLSILPLQPFLGRWHICVCLDTFILPF